MRIACTDGTDTRAQSLLVGAALSVGLTLWAKRRSDGDVTSTPSAWTARTPLGRNVFVGIGIAGAAVTAALWTLVDVNDAFAFRGGFLIAALSTACVLASVVVAAGSWLARLLALGPLRYLGRISYGMYLWHFPLFLWINASNTGLSGAALFCFRFACTVGIATLSYYVVELPIRQRRFLRTAKKAWVSAPASILVVVVFVFAATPAAVIAAPTTFRPPTKQTGPLYTGPPVKLLLVGDSTAYTLGIGLSAYQRDYDIEEKNAGIFGCGVTDGSEFELQGVVGQMNSYCSGRGWYRVVDERLATGHHDVQTECGDDPGRTLGGSEQDLPGSVDRHHETPLCELCQASTDVCGQARRLSRRRAVLLTAPCYDTGEQPNGQPWPEDSPQRLAKYNSIVREVGAAEPNTTVIDFEHLACPSGHYQNYIDGSDVRYDGVHFTLGGGVVFEPELFPVVAQLGREQMAH